MKAWAWFFSGLILVALGGCAAAPGAEVDKSTDREGGTQRVSNALQGGQWQLARAEAGPLAKFAQLSRVTLQFFQADQVAGRDGCNLYNASYRIEGSYLVLGPVAATKMFCAGERGEIERLFLDLLARPLRIDQHGPQQLRLIAEDGTVLHFQPGTGDEDAE